MDRETCILPSRCIIATVCVPAVSIYARSKEIVIQKMRKEFHYAMRLHGINTKRENLVCTSGESDNYLSLSIALGRYREVYERVCVCV